MHFAFVVADIMVKNRDAGSELYKSNCLYYLSDGQDVFSQSNGTDSIRLICQHRDVQNKPLCIIVKPGRDRELDPNSINASDIIKLEVFKRAKMMRKYGEKAKYGVISLTLKEEKVKEILKASKKG